MSRSIADRGRTERFGMPAMPTPRELLFAPLFVAVYVALDWMSFIHPLAGFNITPWNPQPALAIALLMRYGFGWLPTVFVALMASEWVSRGSTMPVPAIVLISAALCIGYALLARALSGSRGIAPAIASQRDAVRLVLITALGSLLTGALFIAALLATHVRPLDEPFNALLRFWIGDTVGIVVT